MIAERNLLTICEKSERSGGRSLSYVGMRSTLREECRLRRDGGPRFARNVAQAYRQSGARGARRTFALAAVTIPQTLEIGVSTHQAGQLEGAEAIYRQILEAEPQHSELLHLLGVNRGPISSVQWKSRWI